MVKSQAFNGTFMRVSKQEFVNFRNATSTPVKEQEGQELGQKDQLTV